MTSLERAYNIVGIVQRVAMVVLTFLMVGVFYKVLTILINLQAELKAIHLLITTFYNLIDKSWMF
jgi:hypothetical protein